MWNEMVCVMEVFGVEIVCVNMSYIEAALSCYYVFVSVEVLSNFVCYDGMCYGDFMCDFL